MYVLLGDPGYPGPPGLRGGIEERGQKGNHDISIYYNCYLVSIGDKGDSGQRGDPSDRGPRGLVGRFICC